MTDDKTIQQKDIESIAAENGLKQIRPGIWERTWIGPLWLYKIRVMSHSHGANLILLSCRFGYGADGDAWEGSNMGNLQSANHLGLLVKWLNTYYEHSRG